MLKGKRIEHREASVFLVLVGRKLQTTSAKPGVT